MLPYKLAIALAALTVLTASIGLGAGYLAQPAAETPLAQVIDDPPAPEKRDQGRCDLYGDPLPPGAIARLGTTRFRASDEAAALAFAADGKTVAVSSRGGLFLFDARSGKRLKRLGHAYYPFRPENAVVFSPDGKHLAARATAQTQVQVWDLDGNEKPRVYDAENLIWIGWSARNEPMAVFFEKDRLRLRELQSGESRYFACPNLHHPQHQLCACAPAALLAVPDTQDIVHVWDTATGKKRFLLEPDKDHYLISLTVSADGRRLAVLKRDRGDAGACVVAILEAATGRVLHSIATGQNYAQAFAFSPDGKTLATASSGGIRWWDVASGRAISRSQGEATSTRMIAFAGDGQTLAALREHSGLLEIWDVATGRRKAAPVGHAGWPDGSAFSPDGRCIATRGGLDGTIHIWDLASSKSLLSIQRPHQWVRPVAWSRDGRWLYSTWTDDQLWISDAVSGEREHVIKLEDPERPETQQSAINMHLSADDRTLTAFSYYYAKKGGGGPGAETLITGWDPATRKQLFRRRLAGIDAHTAVSADARLLAVAHQSAGFRSGSGMGPMRLEDLATGKLLLTFPALQGQTWPLAFAADHRLLAAWNTNYQRRKKDDPADTTSQLVLWEVATARQVLSIPMDGQPCVAFSADGRLVAIPGPQPSIAVWDLAQHGERRRFKGFDGSVTSLAFTPDSRRLISGHADSTLLVWEIPAASPPRHDKPGPDAIAKAWADLAGDDAPRAFRARWTLAGAPEAALPLLAKHLHPAQPADAKRLARLVADLDNEQFATRAAAQKQLEDLGESATPALRQVLAKSSSLELRRRAEALVDRLRGPITDPQQRQAVRAVAVLEAMATPEARKRLAALANGALEARLTQEARAALERVHR